MLEKAYTFKKGIEEKIGEPMQLLITGNDFTIASVLMEFIER